MSIYQSNPTKINAGFTFLSVSVLGIIIAVYIVKNPVLTPYIIVLSIIVGGIIAGMELALVVRKSNRENPPLTREERLAKKEKRKVDKNKVQMELDREKELKMAKYVASIFDEDIPFDEIESNENN